MNKTTIICISFASIALMALGETPQQAMYAAAWGIYTEARGESIPGKLAIASVIQNRAQIKNRTITKTVFKPKAFSGVGLSVPEWFIIDRLAHQSLHLRDYDARQECLWIAQAIAENRFRATGPWTHNYAHDLCTPYWAPCLENVTVIGGHTFGTTRF